MSIECTYDIDIQIHFPLCECVYEYQYVAVWATYVAA